MFGLEALLAVSASANIALMPATEIEVPSREIRLGDVAVLDHFRGATRTRLAARVIARLPRGRNSITLSPAAVAGLVRRSVPGLNAVAGANRSPITIRTRDGTGEAEAAKPSCVALSRPVTQGETLTLADVMPASCEKHAQTQVRFDRGGSLVRAAADLEAGTHLGRLSLPELAGVDRGDKLTLVSRVGPVRIERKVVAVQPGRPGGRIFVRDEEGQVLTAPLQLVKGGERSR